MGAQHVIKLPDIGEGTAEAEIAKWHVSVGQTVKEDDLLVDMMTDKATVEIPSPVTGKVVSVAGAAGDKISVGAVLVVLELSDGQKAPVASASEPAKAAAPVAASAAPVSAPVKALETKASRSTTVALASPATRKKAKDAGLDIDVIPGTGPEGRVLDADVDRYISSQRGGSSSRGARGVKRTEVTEIKVVGLRRMIAERMQEAKRRIPHFTYVEEVDVTELEDLREQLNEGRAKDQPKLTLLPFFITALARTLPEFPQMNARYDDDAGIVKRFAAVDVGIATQTRDGLMVPVLRHAESLNIWEIAAGVSRVAEDARTGKAKKADLTGSTLTVTSLGKLGGFVTTPIINHPEVAILGPNRVLDRPVARNGQLVIRKMMNISSSFDHRVIDGQDAAEFIARIKRLLEKPTLLFV